MSSITGLGGYASMTPLKARPRSKLAGLSQADAPGFLNEVQSKGPLEKALRVV